MTIDRAVARKNKDWGNIHGWIPRLAIQGLYDDYVETKHCQDQTLNDWGKCLGLPHTGYGPVCAIWNEISRFRVVKTRERKIDIEIFCSLLSLHCVDSIKQTKKKQKSSKFGQG